MAYSLEKMNSLEGLKKISLVMDYLMAKAEINSLAPFITLEEDMSIAGVEKQDFEDIISRLIREKVLKNKETIWYEGFGPNGEFTRSTDGKSYNIIINYEKFDKFYKNVVDRVNKLKSSAEGKDELADENITGASFNEDEGVLKIGVYSVHINLKNKKTIAHDLLSFFENDFSKEIDYVDIACRMGVDKEKYLGGDYYLVIWRTCNDIQEKIRKQTKSNINDFLVFNCNRRGSVKINKKYFLPKSLA